MRHTTTIRLYLLLIVFITMTFSTYYHRYPTGDDAWFAEQSYWLEKEGIIRSEFFRGIVGWEKQLLVSHKLFLAFGALLIHFFGFHLPVLQFTGLIFFLIMVAELVLYIRKSKASSLSWFIPAILILVFSNRLLIKMSFENRPEMMLAALGFGSFLLLNSNASKRYLYSTFAGILASMAFLAHMNGIIYIIGGFVTLVYLRRYKEVVIYSIASFAICSLYFIDIIAAENGIETWLFQFRNDPATQASFGLRSKLIQLSTYPTLFFRSPEQVALSILLVYLIWFQRAYINLINIKLRIYFLTLFFSFWLITKGNGGLYLPLFMPFMFALVFELYRLKPFVNLGLKLLLATYFTIGIFGTIQIISKNLTMEYIPVSYQKLRSRLPVDQAGVVPLTFIYNEYENFSRLLTHENYKLYSKKKDMNSDKFAVWSHRKGVKFILMDYKFNAESYYPKAGTSNIPFYKLYFFDGRFAIYKR